MFTAPSWLTPSHGIMAAMLFGFALAHSGLASLRPRGEALMGARAYRVLFALVSLPLAVTLIVYFIGHRYDGLRLWNLQGTPGLQTVVWGLSALSFIFLYPATFNLLEVAAVKQPQVHLYETGIIRITRHPQMVGQVIWCVAHTLWIGTSFTLLTSLGLVAHHLFAVWHGDRRWQSRLGDSFTAVKARTSVVPFLAIIQGRQPLKLQELLRPAYLGVLAFVVGFWWFHPTLISLSQRGAW